MPNRTLAELTRAFRRTTLPPLASMVLLAAACTVPTRSVMDTPVPAPVAGPEEPGAIEAIGLGEDGRIYLARAVGASCILELRDSDGEGVWTRAIDTCPMELDVTSSGDLLLRNASGTEWIEGGSLERVAELEGVLDAVDRDEYVVIADGDLVWRRDGAEQVVRSFDGSMAVILPDESAVIAVRKGAEGNEIVRLGWSGEGQAVGQTVLASGLGRVRRLEPDHDQKELAVEVWREGSWDLAIVNAERAVMNWVPGDPSDEETPRWSEVGYKLSSIVRSHGGDLLRTIHVPTAASVFVDFPNGRIRDYRWYADGERVLVAVSSPLISDHLIEATYTGSSRRVVTMPRFRFDREIDRVPGAPAGSLLILPKNVRYGDRRPLVIWQQPARKGGMEFEPDLVPLLERSDIGVVLVNGSKADLDETFWFAMAEARWLDQASVWVAGNEVEGEMSARNVHRPAPGRERDAGWLVAQIDRERADR